MAAKQLLFSEQARHRILEGVEILAKAVEGHARAARPQRRARQEVGLADRHQGRRDGRQGDRARRAVPQHGRADGARGGVQDLGRRRRRHHHRDRAGRGDLPRGPQERHRRRVADGDQARHRQGGRGRWSTSSRSSAATVTDELEGDRAGRDHLRQRRQGRSARSSPSAMDKVGKDGTITVEEAKLDRDHLRHRRGHGVRQGLHLALLRDREGGAWRPSSRTPSSCSTRRSSRT